MTDEEFDQWVDSFSMDRGVSLRDVRAVILKNTHGLIESINRGKWLPNFIFYSKDSKMVYAIGPRGEFDVTLHMMPYYGSQSLQERHGAALSSFLTGKSCIAFRNLSDLPLANLVEILDAGTPAFLKAFSK